MKLSICGSDGRTLILRIVDSGCPMGVAAAVSGRQYEATAETQEPSEISFLRQSDLLRLMRQHGELALWVTQHISREILHALAAKFATSSCPTPPAKNLPGSWLVGSTRTRRRQYHAGEASFDPRRNRTNDRHLNAKPSAGFSQASRSSVSSSKTVAL